MKRKITVELTVDTTADTKRDVDTLIKAALKGRFACNADVGSVTVLTVTPLPDYRRRLIR